MPPDGAEPALANPGKGTEEAIAGGNSPGTAVFPSIWFFIAADCISFAIFFAVFMGERVGQAEQFNASARQLDARLGLTNTLILITSSWLVALAAAAARQGSLLRVRRLLLGAVGVASGFGLIKLAEYSEKIRHGVTPLTNEFFGYYFALTGVHFLHYIIGMIVLVLLLRKARSLPVVDQGFLSFIQSGGIYWHMVDLLWVFLFPMLYLLGGR